MANSPEIPLSFTWEHCLRNVLVILILLPWFVGCTDVDSFDSISNKPRVIPATTETYYLQADAASVPKSSKEVTLHASIPKQQVQVGKSFDMQLEVTIPPTFHLYRSLGHGNSLKPLEIAARSVHASLKLGNVLLDDSAKPIGGNQVYTNRFTAKIPITLESIVDNNQSVIDLQMSYQICNDLQCLAPSTISLAVPISITRE